MKKIICGMAVVILCGGCAVMEVTDGPGPGEKIVSYRADAPEAMTSHSRMTPYAQNQLVIESQKACPQGYEKISESHVVAPPDGSRVLWKIRCL